MSLTDKIGGENQPKTSAKPPNKTDGKSSNGSSKRCRKYAEAQLASRCANLAATAEGQRNHLLNVHAYQMAGMVARGWIGESTVKSDLGAAAKRSGLDQNEIDATLASGFDDGVKVPAEDPPEQPKADNGNGAARRHNSTPPEDDTQAPEDETAYVDKNWGALIDLGNGERLVARYGDDLRYSYETGKWLIWQSANWSWDKSGVVFQAAKATVRGLYEIAATCPDHKKAAAYAGHAVRSEAAKSINAMIALARGEKGASVLLSELDRDPLLLNLDNGTLDLRTGELRKHHKDDLITRKVPIRWNDKSQCPLWLAFLAEVTKGNQNVVDFLQRAVGYSLTAEIIEQVLFFLLGSGKNGKTTFGVTLQKLLGDYACQARPVTTEATRESSNRASRPIWPTCRCVQ